MSRSNDDRFRIRPGTPKQRGDAFINEVLHQTNKAGAKLSKRIGEIGQRPGSRLGRGHVAALFAGASLTPNARRVTIKARLVHLAKAGPRSTATHLRYIEREGVDRQGGRGHAYGPSTDAADTAAFDERGHEDRHQFRFILSPEDAEQLDDLRTYTRHLMARMAADLGTRLDWVAVDHWNTDNPHTHVVLRGKDDTGKDLIISRDYIAEGMRRRASELATGWLGPRTELDIQQAMQREVDRERWTGLDRTLQREAKDGLVLPETLAAPGLQRQRQMLIGRLQHLQRMGLATEKQPGEWALHAEAESALRAMGERGDIIRTMQRVMSGMQRELAVFQPDEVGNTIVGRVAAKGLADELHDKGYLVIDGIDGKAHYVALPPRSELEQYPTGAVVEVKGATGVRTVDRNIAALSVDGIYRADHHLAFALSQTTLDHDPRGTVAAHVRRLEALSHSGIVERMAGGIWRVPCDLAERGHQYDAQRLGGDVAVELKSHITIERQTYAVGATWLDQHLVLGGEGLSDVGFGSEVKDALRQRTSFLTKLGLAKRKGIHLVLIRDLLAKLCERELTQVSKQLETQIDRSYIPFNGRQHASGVYRQSIQLNSGRFALLDTGLSFSLVPWSPAIESRLGHHLTAVVMHGRLSWELSRTKTIPFS